MFREIKKPIFIFYCDECNVYYETDEWQDSEGDEQTGTPLKCKCPTCTEKYKKPCIAYKV